MKIGQCIQETKIIIMLNLHNIIIKTQTQGEMEIYLVKNKHIKVLVIKKELQLIKK